jgi:hypothetical protein
MFLICYLILQNCSNKKLKRSITTNDFFLWWSLPIFRRWGHIIIIIKTCLNFYYLVFIRLVKLRLINRGKSLKEKYMLKWKILFKPVLKFDVTNTYIWYQALPISVYNYNMCKIDATVPDVSLHVLDRRSQILQTTYKIFSNRIAHS